MKKYYRQLFFLLTLFSAFVSAFAQGEQVITLTTNLPKGSELDWSLRPVDANGKLSEEITLEGVDYVEKTRDDGRKEWVFVVANPNLIRIKGPVTVFYADPRYYRERGYGITSIQFENGNKLERLAIVHNPLTEISLRSLPYLHTVKIMACSLTTVDIADSPRLRRLQLQDNKISNIDLTKLPKTLEILHLSKNNLSSIDLSVQKEHIKDLRLEGNKLSGDFVLEGFPNLLRFFITNNPIASFVAEGLPKLHTLALEECKELKSISLKNLESLSTLRAKNAGALENVTLENIESLEDIRLSGNKLSSLEIKGLKGLPKLQVLDLSDNLFTSVVPLTGFPELRKVSMNNNQLTEFTIANCGTLEHLELNNNQLSTLDLSKIGLIDEEYPQLEIQAKGNKLTSVKLGVCKELDLSNNQLTTLDVSPCAQSLTDLQVDGNQIEELDLSSATKLIKVSICGNNLHGATLDRFISSLPTKDRSFLYPLYIVHTRSEKENNVCTPEQVKAAKEKGWQATDGRTRRSYPGVMLRTITTKVEGEGGKLFINGETMLGSIATDTRVNISVEPEEGYTLKEVTFHKEGALASDPGKDLFVDRHFWVEDSGEVRATFTNEIGKIHKRQIGYGEFKIKGEENFDLNSLPKGREFEVIAKVKKEDKDKRELKSLTAGGKDIKEGKKFTLDADRVDVVAEFVWVHPTEKDPLPPYKECLITTKVEGEGGKLFINGEAALDPVLYGTDVAITAEPAEGYTLKTATFHKEGAPADDPGVDLFADRKFSVEDSGEVRATFTNEIGKIHKRQIGYGDFKIKGEENFDLNSLPKGREFEVIANVKEEDKDKRDLKSLTAGGKDIKEGKKFTLDADRVDVVAEFVWVHPTEKDPLPPYDSDQPLSREEIAEAAASLKLFPNPAAELVYIESASPAAQIALFSLNGELLARTTASEAGRAELNVADLGEGVYVVRVGGVAHRLVVRH